MAQSDLEHSQLVIKQLKEEELLEAKIKLEESHKREHYIKHTLEDLRKTEEESQKEKA